MSKKVAAQYFRPNDDSTNAGRQDYGHKSTSAWISREELDKYLNRNEFIAYKESFESKLNAAIQPILSDLSSVKWVFGVVLGIVTLILSLLFIIYPNMLNKDDAKAIENMKSGITAFERTVNKNFRELHDQIDSITKPKIK